MKKKITCICICTMLVRTVFPIIVVRGNETSQPYGFTQNITVSTYDPHVGTFFVGLESGANQFSISRAVRPNFSTTPTFVPVANNVLNNASIKFLSHLPHEKNPALAAVEEQTGSLSNDKITVLSTDGSRFDTTESINDASGTNTTDGIVQIANSQNCIISAVRPNNGNFGDTDGGLALIEVDRSLSSVISVEIIDAQTGQEGNKAKLLNNTSTVITGNTGNINDVTFLSDTDENKVTMHYDDTLDLFYIGIRIQTANMDDAIGKAVVIAEITDNGVVLKEIVTNEAIAVAPQTDGQTFIIAQKGNGIQLKTFHVATMHTSTGFSYLITNSLNNSNNAPNANFNLFALPLVNNPESNDHGKIANPNTFTNDFNTAETDPTKMVTSQHACALIGGGPLPIEAVTEIKQIQVVTDTVYVGLGNTEDNLNNTGIFYSQAQFNSFGTIVNWTPWAKRSSPIDTFLPNNETEISGRVNFFAVDPVSGSIWIAENTTKKIVGITSWTDTGSKTDILVVLNEQLSDGCFCALDLHSATRGFTDRNTGMANTIQRYALFGGYDKVIVTRTAQATENTTLTFPETIQTDFSSIENIRTTRLPNNSGAVRHIAYSKQGERDNTQANFFFSGTNMGLYVFALSNGEGFPVTSLSDTNSPPFTIERWSKVELFTDPITDLSCEGNALYVLTSGFTPEQPFVDKLYVIPFSPEGVGDISNITELFSSNNIHLIAQTGVDIFKNVTRFTGVSVAATDQDQNITQTGDIIVDRREQLLLATSNGLFATNANQMTDPAKPVEFFQGTPDVKNQTDAQWFLIENTNNTLFRGITSTDSPVHHTSWPFSLQDPLSCNIFNAGSIHQVSGAEQSDSNAQESEFGTFDTTQFTTNQETQTIEPIINFWTDGARRFFILNRTNDPSQQNVLSVLPFDTQTFAAQTSSILTHPILKKQEQFYWIQLINTQGRLFAGTNNGIVSLQ